MLSAALIAGIIFACTLGGALLGMRVRGYLPPSHVDTETKEAIKPVMTLISVLSALMLGLFIGAAKSTYDTEAKEMEQLATNLVRLDRTLAHYGDDTDRARALLRESAIEGIERLWPSSPGKAVAIRPSSDFAHTEAFYVLIQNLKPQNDVQRQFQSQALLLGSELSESRMRMYIASTRSISSSVLIVLGFWLTTLFFGFGLFARPHATSIGAFIIGALSIGGAVFLASDLEDPFVGVLRVQPLALMEAVAQMRSW